MKRSRFSIEQIVAALRACLGAARDARWLTAERVRAHARTVAVISILTLATLALTSSGGVDVLGRPIGTDFSSFYAAGRLASAGQASSAYDWPALHTVEQSIFGEQTPFYSWAYPPFALAPMAAISSLPYGWALALFLGSTFVAYWFVTRHLAPAGREAFWAIAGFPGVFVNAAYGQNGFLSTALLGAGLMLLPQRPVMAGVAIGLMAFKPQLAIFVPIALVCGRHWATAVAAAATVACMIGLGLLAYGVSPFHAFFDAMLMSREAILEEGATGFEKLQSVLGAVRLLGGSSAIAWTGQAIVSLVAAVAVITIWRGDAPQNVKSAVLVTAGLLGTPFLNVYDLVLLALPVALITASEVRYVPRSWEGVTFLSAWLLPIVSVPVAQGLKLPLAPLLLTALLVVCARRVMHLRAD